VGFLDGLLGGKRKLSGPAAKDRLFAIVTAQVALETSLGLQHKGKAGICFQALQTADFERIVTDAQELLEGAAADTGTKLSTADDEFGYRWIVFEDADFDDLVTSVNTVSGELVAGGYGDRVLAAVFAFEDVYFIYNYKRGFWYPFVPKKGAAKERDTERELRLKAQLSSELPIEPELDRWFPLWEIPL
jgi:hypothetical protein